MKEIARIKNYIVDEFWFKYYVFWEDENKETYECGWFETLNEAINYIMAFEK